MKKLLLLPVLLTFTLMVSAQCDDVFISEYVEGRYNNKALELYNPTNDVVNLSDYRIVRWSNGNFIYDPLYKVDISGFVQPKGVYVLVLDKRDPQGSGNEQQVDDALQAKADTFLCPIYNVNRTLYHNGNDAITLEKRISGTWTVIDVFAEIGVDPGNAWTDNPNASPPFTDGPGGTWWTRDRVLVRQPDVINGLTTTLTAVTGAASEHPTLESAPSPFDPRAEWDTLPRDWIYDTVLSPYVDSLGTHTCDCNKTTGIREVYSSIDVNVYPNPANTSDLAFSAASFLQRVQFFDILGKRVLEVNFNQKSKIQSVDISGLRSGIYLVEVYGDKNGKTVEKVIIP